MSGMDDTHRNGIPSRGELAPIADSRDDGMDVVAYGWKGGKMIAMPRVKPSIDRASFQERRIVNGVEEARAGYCDEDGREVVAHPWEPT